jgi:hypothetical protein
MITMTQIENPRLSMDELTNLQKKIEGRIASASDFEKLDYFLFSLGAKKLILNKLKEYNLNSYSEFIESKNRPLDPLTNELDKNIQGISLGIISYLRTYLLK